MGFTANAEGVYQIPNGNADMEWSADNEPGNGLHSFKNASLGGSSILLNTGKKNAQDLCYKETGRTGKAIAIKSKSVAGIAKANGNLTTGNIIMGSPTPANKANHNETRREMGADGSLEFVGLPDSLEFYSKYSKGENSDYNGNVNAFIHGDCDYADPMPDGYPTKEEYVVAYLQFPITPSTDWKRFSGAFEYYTPSQVDMTKDTRYLLLNMTTNPTPGATAGDVLIVDDIRFIYNSKLETLTYGGVDLLNGNKDVFKFSVDGEYDASMLAYTADGKGASVTTKYDEASKVLTITVSGNDISVDAKNLHTYEIEFIPAVIEVKPVLVSAMEFIEWLVVKNGETASEPVKKSLAVELYDNLKANLKMSDVTPVIAADSVAYTKDGDLTLIKGTAADGTVVDLVAGADTAYGTISVDKTVMEYGIYTPPTIVVSEVYSDTMYSVVNGVASEADVKAISADYYSDAKAVLTIDNLTVGTFELGKVEIADLKYETVGDSIVISGSARVSTKLGTIPMTIKSAKTDAEYKGLKAIIGVDLSTLGYIAELKFGFPTEKKNEEVIEPEVIVIKEAVYEDYMNYGDVITEETIVISYYSNGYATVVFPNNKMFIDSVAYERGADSIRFVATDIIVSGASSLDYSKLQMTLKDGRTFGLSKPVLLVKSVVYNDSIVVLSNGDVVTEGHKDLKIDFYENGYATISLLDFALDEEIVVGDIIVDSVPYTITDSVRMSAKRNVTVAPKLGTIGASLGVLPVDVTFAITDLEYASLDADINIDMAVLGEKVNVIFGAEKTETIVPAPTVVMSAKFNDVLNANGELKESAANVEFYSDKSVVVKVENMTMSGLRYTLGDSLRASGNAVLTMAGNSLDVNVNTFVADRALSKLYMDITAGTNSFRFGYDTIPVVPEIPDTTPVTPVVPDTTPVIPGGNGPKLLRTVVYTDDLVINISGDDMAPQTQDITVAYYDNGFATLSIMNFIMGEGEDGMLVGDIVLDSVPYSETDSIRMQILKNIFITSDDPDAMGNALPEIPVEIKSATSSNNFDKLQAIIGIDLEDMYVTVNFGFSDKTNTGVVEENAGPKLLRTVVYTDDLVINISGDDMAPQTQDITVAYYDNGMATLSIMNFVMGEGEDGMLVGDIVLENVPYTQEDSIRMQILKKIFITSDNPDAMGNMLPEIPVEIKSATSSNNYDKLKAVIGIDLEDMYVTVNFGFSDKKNTGVVEESGSEEIHHAAGSVVDNMTVSVNGDYYNLREGKTRLSFKDNKLTLTLVDLTVNLGDGDIIVGDVKIELPATTSDMIYFEGEDTVKIITDDIYEIGNQTEYARVRVSEGRSKLELSKVFYDMEVELIDLGITFNINFGDSTTVVHNMSAIVDNVVDTRVFTIIGACVGDNVEITMLPAGIYIRNGKKFIVRSK